MNITPGLRERFCKDCNIPIKIFEEPYFTSRLELYDPFYNTIEKYKQFLHELESFQHVYDCEHDYYEHYKSIKEEAVVNIKCSDGFNDFNTEDMQKFAVTHKNLSNHHIFRPQNNEKTFISIDMIKANFSSLHHYNADIFDYAATWEDFMKEYTDNGHIIRSKYIRQVILGMCNPKRQVTYEKYLMDQLLTKIVHPESGIVSLSNIVFFSNDEIVIDISEFKPQQLKQTILREVRNIVQTEIETPHRLRIPSVIPCRVEMFTLYEIPNTGGYIKLTSNNELEFKCFDSYMLPFVFRTMLQQEIREEDTVFYHQGLKSRFLETPDITIPENILRLVEEDHGQYIIAKNQ